MFPTVEISGIVEVDRRTLRPNRRFTGLAPAVALIAVAFLSLLLTQPSIVHAQTLAIDGTANSASTPCSITCSVTLTTSNSNDVIIVFAGGNAAEENQFDQFSFGTPTANGLTFHTRETYCPSLGTLLGVGEWWAVASSPLSNETITLTATPSADGMQSFSMIAYGISGANTASPFDPNLAHPARAVGISASESSSVRVSTSNPNDVILAVVGGGFGVGGGSAGTSGFTIWSVSANPAAAEYVVVSSTQSGLTVKINFGGPSTWVMLADAVQART
jgi:hypothetical protein